MFQKFKNIYHLGVATFSNIWFGFPSKKLTVIGVTGTDGKTTTTSLIYHILSKSGHNASMISSVGAIIGGKKYDVGFHVTTPSPFALQNFIKKVVDVGSKYLVLETTSHAIDQYRNFGIDYSVSVLTNVTHEHLDYHKTYENYVKTKEKLLKKSKIAITNRDDKSYALLKIKSITYGMRNNADVNTKKFPFQTNMIGDFNTYNALAAISVCKELGISDKNIREALRTFKTPVGRQDIVYKNGFTVMIDFAHTPNAFDVVLKPLRKMIKGKIIHVFGSAGERDKTKRPIMGRISGKYADIVILTSEDPRSESSESIMGNIESGIKNHKLGVSLFKIKDRKEAIRTAIKMASKGDLILLTGKSHEVSMNYGNGEENWDEYGIARQALRLRKLVN